ncbi:MAG: Ditrans,polycis-undecaprenyl-diphosphate synthase ((2E,6E)-farnesyl-diphosphate specific) [Flavobacteriaceae bacterium]|nr:MAG: Ditrans,polycis-undecaprenyl-diphosphate synthase ((2E,6E)-farnesyl-diphosphate specific) [Flavobacteriaceae bacterium]
MKSELNLDKMPAHVAIIMDGNGRWASTKGKNRLFGHKNGVQAVRAVVEESVRLGIKHLTLYAFSSENWQRPKEEIGTLMRLLVQSLRSEFEKLLDNNIKLQAVGEIDELPQSVQDELFHVINKTANNSNMTLTLALSYGARQEITSAVKKLGELVKNNLISPDDIDDSTINKHLCTHKLPDVDLLIRTSGEQRVSNFLLWQIAYAELYFTNVFWPDFREQNLQEALLEYQKRERRFGKTSAQINA